MRRTLVRVVLVILIVITLYRVDHVDRQLVQVRARVEGLYDPQLWP